MNMFDQKETWFVQYCGGEYEIRYNVNRNYLQPKWFVKRMNDGKESVRYYSRAGGAFISLSSDAIKWEEA